MLTRAFPEQTREYIRREGRLLERQLSEVIFNRMPPDMFLKALEAYQNEDGGFGNGIEPDLLTPNSSGVGLETACFYLDMLLHHLERNHQPRPVKVDSILRRAAGWVEKSIDNRGIIPLLPEDFKDYPYQVWWLNPDDTRVLSIMGYLAKFNIGLQAKTHDAVEKFAETLAIPDDVSEYNYPLFVYAANETSFTRWDEVLEILQRRLSEHIYEDRDRYFLLTRYWYHFIDMMPEELVEQQVDLFFDSLEDDGGVPNPYPDLPWWRPMVSLDYLLILSWMNVLHYS